LVVKRTLAILAAVVAGAALSGAGAISALAAAPRGTLTSHEYALLTRGEQKAVTAMRKQPVNWNALPAVCRTLGSSTTLLKSERASCLAEAQLFRGLVDFPRQESDCGTTEPHKDICIVPLYVGLTKDAEAMYQADVVEDQVAAQRGFTGRCLEALANTAKQLEQQHELATATAQITKDVQTSTAVIEGKLPSTDVNVAQVDADAKTFEHDVNLVLGQSTPKLSTCPHQ
jgi:hypothetical protein